MEHGEFYILGFAMFWDNFRIYISIDVAIAMAQSKMDLASVVIEKRLRT